jgi:hypothetical protein
LFFKLAAPFLVSPRLTLGSEINVLFIESF